MRVPMLVFATAMLAGLCLPLDAQSAFRAPVSGYILDAQIQAIRPIQGFPGSAVFGEPLDLPAPISAVTVAESGAFALATTGGDAEGLLLIRGLRGGVPRAAPVDGVIAGVELIAISSDGSTAVLLSRRTPCLQFLTGLPDQPSPQAPIALTDLSGRITALAVSSSGHQAALAATLDQTGAIYQVDAVPGSALRSVATPQHPVNVFYVNQDRDLIYLDAGASRLVLLRNAGGSREQQVLLSSEQGLQAPSSISVSGSRLWLADTRIQDSISTGHLIVLDLESAQVTSEKDLSIVPDRLQTLGSPGVFALNALQNGPVYLLSSADSSVAFVPSIVR